jgi:exodeoxyribonuclease V beta subunit
MGIGKLEVEQGQKTPMETSELDEEIKLTHYGVQELRVVEVENDDKRYKSMLFGTALHYTLEMVKGFNLENLKEAMFATKNRYGLELTPTQFDEVERRVSQLLSNLEFQALLKCKNISREQSLSYGGELKQLDLLLEYEDRFLVVDYKSSKQDHFKHVFQVSEYIKAIEEILKKPTDGVIIYLLEGGIEFFRVE